MIRRAILCVLMVVLLPVVLLPSCSLLLPGDPAPVVAREPNTAYALTIEFVETCTDAPATGATTAGGVLPENAVTGAVGIVGFFQGIPYIGPLFFGSEIVRNATKNLGGDAGAPVTSAVFIEAIRSGRVLKITYTPVEIGAPK